jgi:hypothetical protein
MDKYVFTLIGVCLGALLTIGRELYAEKRSNKKDAEYLAIRLICLFDTFMENCASVVGDDGLFHGQTDEQGCSRIQVLVPELNIHIDDVNWKALPSELMYDILSFPNLVSDANRLIDSTFEFSASPPDFSEGFEERQNQYSILGIKASIISDKLRSKYKIPKNQITNWDIVEYMLEEQRKIKDLRIKRQVEYDARKVA